MPLSLYLPIKLLYYYKLINQNSYILSLNLSFIIPFLMLSKLCTCQENARFCSCPCNISGPIYVFIIVSISRQIKGAKDMLDEEVLKKAQDGDYKSIEEICSSTWETLYRFIYYKVQNRQEAEDITQETYVKALSFFKKGGFKVDKYISYLKSISLNVLRDKWRKNRHHGASLHFDEIGPEITAVEDPAENSTQRALLQGALCKLNDEQRRVIELRIIQGYSVAETAKIMSKKESNIRVLQYRALQVLSSNLENIEE
jgi:RNA polymerase sigma factor, sigma-70 family